jgi:4-hydroxythreonine-4-phosphate dehydrogenase
VSTQVLITADDRTGALETAGLCADSGSGPVAVVVHGTESGVSAGRMRVIDLDSRHLTDREAARDAAGVCAGEDRHLHKMDSTLRGNWAHEALAIGRARSERVLVVPALPALGRVCRNGIVFVDGVAVHEGPLGADPRNPVWSSRPAEHLRDAGAYLVDELADETELGRWLAARGAGVAVCDASTDADVRRIATVWSGAGGVVLVGTSAVVAEGLDALRTEPRGAVPEAPSFPAPVLVVCGSLHPGARAQIDALRAESLPGVEVIASDPTRPGPVVPDDAARTATALADAVARSDARTIVVLGGDTAAAVLGLRPVVVGGTAMPGAPWMRLADGRLVVTRAGGFGDPAALVRCIADRIVG